MSQIFLNSTIVRSSNQVSTNLGGEVVILGLQSEQYCGLADVGASIWSLIQEPKTVQEVLEVLLNEYAVEHSRCEGDLLAFLQVLASEDLIMVVNEEMP